MFPNRYFAVIAVTAAFLGLAGLRWAAAEPAESLAPESQAASQNQGASNGPGKLTVTVGKSLVIDSPINIRRVSVANGDLVEAVAVNPKEVLINGKGAGDTSLVIWQENGTRLLYDLTVRMNTAKLDAVRDQIMREFPNDNINVTYENETAFVRGTVKDVVAADRVMAIASTLGKDKTINLLRVDVPPVETQVLLKVRFANVDRSVETDLGFNLLSGAGNQLTGISTGQFAPPTFGGGTTGTITYTDPLNIFLFRKDLNLFATIKALESKNLLEMLAEPNVMAINGKEASFLAGGEFPFPMVQGGAVGSVTIAFREFGVRLNFLPTVTPRGTIRLQVAPEVSSLDFTNAVVFQGFTIPALATRRVKTEVELESGQSFVIGGLLDNQTSENLNKLPGLSAIPLFGKLFQTKVLKRSNTELLVLVTPEIVRPLPAGQPIPTLNLPAPYMDPNSKFEMHQPSISQTGPVPVQPPSDSVPFEELVEKPKEGQASPNPTIQLVMPQPPLAPNPNPGLGASGASGGSSK
ncbi:MAG TPA: pilus assembly protein N-terminal domain-containing protein [Bryobacteraceae bacterium]|nr:pilus assembly protein N-terminal domain-containing protein [Bryobacteraceae bacterium]